MKAKDIANQLGSLAASVTSQGNYYGNNTNNIDLDIPEELQEPDPIFTIDHDIILQQNFKKALKSVKYIVRSVVPELYLSNQIINDKIDLDAELLGQLYYQQSMNNIMIKTVMDTIAKGDTSAKLFDSYTKLMAMAKDFNKQITELQNQFRKYYIDTYLDLLHKADEELIQEENSVKTLTNKDNKQTIQYIPTDDELSRRETSSKDTVLKVLDWKRQQYKELYEKNKLDN